MSTVSGGSAARASVAFLKIQEFARRPVMDQMRLRAQLEAVIAVITAELASSSRIVLDASDGAAIVVLDDPAATLRAAEQALAADAAGLPLSVGINHGAVQLSDGGKGGDGMNGDGISVAANIADFASPSRLLASSDFRDALADASPGAETRLAPAGVLTDPGLRSHELFGPDVQGPRRRRQRYAAFAVAVVVAGIAAGVAYRVSLEGSERFFGGLQAKGAGYLSAGLSRLRFWEVPPSQIAPPLRGKAARDKGRG